MQSVPDRREDERKAMLVCAVVSYATGAPVEEVLLGSRGGAGVSWARHVAMYLANGVFAMSHARIAAAFGRDRSTIGHAINKIEDWRESARADQWLQGLERMLRETPTDAPPGARA